jgi:hypothetical protein
MDGAAGLVLCGVRPQERERGLSGQERHEAASDNQTPALRADEADPQRRRDRPDDGRHDGREGVVAQHHGDADVRLFSAAVSLTPSPVIAATSPRS